MLNHYMKFPKTDYLKRYRETRGPIDYASFAERVTRRRFGPSLSGFHIRLFVSQSCLQLPRQVSQTGTEPIFVHPSEIKLTFTQLYCTVSVLSVIF